MPRFFQRPIRSAGWLILLAAVVLLQPSQARAAFSVEVYDDGVQYGGTVIPVSGQLLFYNFSTAHFTITSGTGNSNNPGTPTLADLVLGNTTNVTSTVAGTHTIRIVLSETGFLLPNTSPLLLTDSLAGTYTLTTAGDSFTSSSIAMLDPTNTLFGDGSGTNVGPTGTGFPGQSTPPTTASGTGPAAAKNFVGSPLTSQATAVSAVPFALTQVLDLTVTSTSPNGDAISATQTFDAQPIAPAPAGLVLALTGLPLLAAGWLRRRRMRA